MQTPPSKRIMRQAEVLAVTSASKNTIFRWVARGSFPPPVKIGSRAIGWRSSDVEAWLESLPVADTADTRAARQAAATWPNVPAKYE